MLLPVFSDDLIHFLILQWDSQLYTTEFSFLLSAVNLPLSLSLSRPVLHTSSLVLSLSFILLLWDELAFWRQNTHRLSLSTFANISDQRYLHVSVYFSMFRPLSLTIIVSSVFVQTMVCLVIYLKALALQCPLPISETCLYPCLLLISHNKIIRIQHIPWHSSHITCSNRASITMRNKGWLRQDRWCTLTVSTNYLVLPMPILTEVLVSSYTDFTSHTIFFCNLGARSFSKHQKLKIVFVTRLCQGSIFWTICNRDWDIKC